MAEKRPSASKPNPAGAESGGREQRMPTNAELLHELRKHGAEPPPPAELPAISRRTRDFLLVAGTGSLCIGVAALRLLRDHGSPIAVQVALTGIVVFCGLLWFIFFHVMSRY